MKKHLKKTRVKQMRIPLWPELSMTNIFPEAIKLQEFVDHIPDEWIQNPSKAERSFVWGVLVSVAEDYVEFLLKDCREQRMSAQIQRINQPQQIHIAQEWIQPLLDQPYISQHGNQNILISRRQQIPQRRQPPPQRIIQPRVTMQAYIDQLQAWQQQNGVNQGAGQNQSQQNINGGQIDSRLIPAQRSSQQIQNNSFGMSNQQRMNQLNLDAISEVNEQDLTNLNISDKQDDQKEIIQPKQQIQMNNQLELQDPQSEVNSVMGQSPIQASKRSSSRRGASKQRIDIKSKVKQPEFDQ